MIRTLQRLGLAGLLLWQGVVALAAPPIEHWTLDNGARVYFVAAPELPMLDLRVVFDAGSARDGDHPGLATLTSALLDQGAAGADADTIAADFEGVGANLSTGSLRDMAWLQLRSLSAPQYLDPALARFRDLLMAPDFPAEAFERQRRRLQVAWRQGRQDPATLASEAFYAALYGDHPYASPSGGTEDSLAAIEPEQVRAFHRRYYVAANAVLAIVGDLDRRAAERLAAQLVGDLPRGEPAPALPPVEPLQAGRELRLAFPSSQTHVLVGAPGLKRGEADYFPLYVGNHVLGGSGLVSLLSEEVREKRGLSYSAYSYFAPMRELGPFQLGLQTRNDQTAEALAVARETLAGFIEQGPQPDALAAAKSNLIGGRALSIDSNKEILEYIAMIGFYGLPLDYLERFEAWVAAVDVAAARAAFQRRLDVQRMVTVIVGGGVVEDPPVADPVP